MLALPTSLDSPVQWYLSNHRIVSGFSINAEDLGQATIQDYNNVLFTALEEHVSSETTSIGCLRALRINIRCFAL